MNGTKDIHIITRTTLRNYTRHELAIQRSIDKEQNHGQLWRTAKKLKKAGIIKGMAQTLEFMMFPSMFLDKDNK